MKSIIPALALSILPSTTLAHPHVFIDAGISFIFNDDGHLSAVKVEWAYDDFYTMLKLEDMGLDQDGDGVITVEEQKQLLNDQKITFGGPMDPTAEIDQGRLVTSHVRHLEQPIDLASGLISLKVFDPTYYTAYTLELGAEILNRKGCSMEQIPADLGKAYDLVEQLLYGVNDSENYPAVGENFADTLTLSCETSS